MTDEAKMWRRRERGMFIGVVLWASAVAAAFTLRPEAVAELLLSTEGVVIGAYTLLTIGLSGGIGHALMVAFGNWLEPDVDPELTEGWQ